MLKRFFQFMVLCLVVTATFTVVNSKTEAASLSRFANDGSVAAVNTINVDLSSFDSTNDFYFQGFNVAIFENNGTSYSMIASTVKEIKGCGKILNINPNTYTGYVSGKSYKIAYRILYSFSEEDSDIFILNKDNGKDGWMPVKNTNGKDLILFLYDAAGAGNGLTGTYYNHSGGTSIQELTRIDDVINFNWGSSSPISTNDRFNVIWRGYISPLFTGNYKFAVNSDDGVYLKINGVELLKDWTCHSSKEETAEVALVEGQKYEIELRYFEDLWGSNVSLYWSAVAQGLAESIVPKGCLYIANDDAFSNLKITKETTSSEICIGDPMKYKFEATANDLVTNPTVVIEKDLLDNGSVSGFEIRPYFSNFASKTIDKSKYKVFKNGVEIANTKYTVEYTSGNISIAITDSTVEFNTNDILAVEYTVSTVSLDPSKIDTLDPTLFTVSNYISQCKKKITTPAGLETIPANNASSPTTILINCDARATVDTTYKKRFKLD